MINDESNVDLNETIRETIDIDSHGLNKKPGATTEDRTNDFNVPMVMYCLISRAISTAWSVWILLMRCCIKFPHFMSRYRTPSSVSICLVEMTSVKG